MSIDSLRYSEQAPHLPMPVHAQDHLEPNEIRALAAMPRRAERYLAWLIKQHGGRVTLTPEDQGEAAELELVESRDVSGSRILTHAKKGMGS